MLCDLGHMEKTVSSGEDLNERPELSDPYDLAEIDLADLRNRRDVADHLNRARQAIRVARCNIDPTRIINVDLDAGRIDDAANDLAARSDEITNLVGGNLDGVNAWSKLRLLRARSGEGSVHRIQQPEPAKPRLFKSLTHDLRRDAHDLDVHL